MERAHWKGGNFSAEYADRVRINVNDSAYIEMDTWYGAKFNKDISQIQDGISKLLRSAMIMRHDV